MYGYIYKTTNLINGKIYIGQHKKSFFDPKYKGSGKIFQEALKKYGKENFEVIMLEAFDTFEELNAAEIRYIKMFDARNSDLGYNLAEGGNLFSNNYHQGMAGKKQTTFQKEQVRRALTGKPKSDEARKHMSEAARKRISNRITNNGKRWIHNEFENKLIETSSELPLGYEEGMMPSMNKSNSQKKRHQNSIYMHNDEGEERLVEKQLVSEYKLKGYREGRRPYSEKRLKKLHDRKGKILIHDPQTLSKYYISPEDLPIYLSKGYVKGRPKII